MPCLAFERWLTSYPGTVIVISHDTEFLDAVAKSILHFDQEKLDRYRGGYNDFLSQRAERLRQTQIAHERQGRETARLQAFIDRFKAKATKAKQAQSRVKALARMQELAPLRADSALTIRLPTPSSMPDPLITINEASLGYVGADTRIILQNLKLDIRGGDRIGVLGVNGAGKSTLIKTLAGELDLVKGQLQKSNRLEVGYFAQHQLDMIDPDASPIQHLARIAPDTREQELRNYLGSFAFSGDMASDTTAGFSGGEKARLALALIVWRKPNLLLLDEPTNHLDVDTREALSNALAEYEGSVLIVSHDRQLLRSTVDDFWIVADGGVQAFDGDLEDYRDWLQQRSSAERSLNRQNSSQTESNEPDRRTQRRLEAEARQRIAGVKRPLEKALKVIEQDMEKAASRIAELDELIADPEFYSDTYKDTRPSHLAEHGELSKKHSDLENSWLETQEKIEQLV